MAGHDPRTAEDLAAAEEYGVTWSGTMAGTVDRTRAVVGMEMNGDWSVWRAVWPSDRKGIWTAPTLAGALALAALDNWGE